MSRGTRILLLLLLAQCSLIDLHASPVSLAGCPTCLDDEHQTIETVHRKKVALVLAGGGARGLAHVGVIRAFEEAGVPVDLVCGTSMGALVGGLWCMGRSADELDSLCRNLDWEGSFYDKPRHHKLIGNARFLDRVPGIRFELKNGHLHTPSQLFKGSRVELMLDDLTLGAHGELDFLDLPRPFACAATDLEKGNAVYLTRGRLSRALRASMSLPSIFEPVQLDGRILVDGGVVQNLPTDLALRLGADIIIAVNLPVYFKPADELDGLIEIADQSRQIMAFYQEKAAERLADLVILPEVTRYGIMEFEAADTLIERGYEAAVERLPEINELMQQAGIVPHECHYELKNRELDGELWLAQMRVVGEATLELSKAQSMLGLKPGDTFTARDVSRTIRNFLSSGLTQRAGYEVEELDGYSGVGPRPVSLVLHLDGSREALLDIEPAFHEQDNVLLGVRLDWRNLTGPGSYLRLEGILGGATQLTLDGWRSRYHNAGFALHPHAWYSDVNVHLYDDEGRKLARYNMYRGGLGYGVAFILRKGARAEVGVEWEYGMANPDIADPAWEKEESNSRMAYAGLSIDTRDQMDLPTRGFKLDADLREIRDQELDGRRDLRWLLEAKAWHILHGHVNRELDLPWHSGLLLLEVGGGFGRSSDAQLSPAYFFDLGGWPMLPGYEEGRTWTQEYTSIWVGPRYWLTRNISFMPAVSWLEAGDDMFSKSGRTQSGAGLELTARTYFGPLRLALGRTRNGETAGYARFGWRLPNRHGR